MRAEDTNSGAVSIPQASYALFEAKRDGMDAVIAVNQALLSFVHARFFPGFLTVTLNAKELTDNGMPAPSESELLAGIGDEIENILLGCQTKAGAQNALFLACITSNGTRQLLFYVHDPEITNSALQSLLRNRSWEREWSYRMENDSDWANAAQVFQLFPQAGHLHS